MRFHECIQLRPLLLLLRRGQARLLLPLVVHHFLDDTASVTIQVRKLRVLRLDLLCVNLFITLNDGFPPVLLVFLGE